MNFDGELIISYIDVWFRQWLPVCLHDIHQSQTHPPVDTQGRLAYSQP